MSWHDESSKDSNSKEKLRKILLLLSKKRAVSPSQVSFNLRMDPSESVSLTRHLVDKGLVDGPTTASGSVIWNRYYSLSTKGIKLTQSLEKEEEFL